MIGYVANAANYKYAENTMATKTHNFRGPAHTLQNTYITCLSKFKTAPIYKWGPFFSYLFHYRGPLYLCVRTVFCSRLTLFGTSETETY